MENDFDKRYQTLIVLWFALLMSVAMYFLFSVVAAPETHNQPDNPRGPFFIGTLTGLGALLVLVSFFVKHLLLERSVANQDINLVQKALIVACAMCEVSALLGLLESFVIGSRAYYLLFLFAATGIALHFPRRIQLESASYKKPEQLD